MSPWRRVRWSASVVVACILPWGAAPASAQLEDPGPRAPDLSPEPLSRSPRLLGMGRLSLVVDDPHNRINLWDLGANPAGITDADSTSTLELRPGTATASSVHDIAGAFPARERQDLAGRDFRIGYETWRRPPGGTTFGAIGHIGTRRLDQPISDDVERRSLIGTPNVTGIVSGLLPYVKSGRMRYGLRVIYGGQTSRDEYRTVVSNAAGDYLDLDGELLNPPDFFNPDQVRLGTLGLGAAAAYRFGTALTVGLGFDGLGDRLRGDNSGKRYNAEISEHRGYRTGQATLIGRLGRELEWGVDGHGWRSASQQNWSFTISAGIGAIPLEGRGKLLEREEEGTTMRGRARWTHGPIELGAGLSTAYRKITLTPPDPNDLTSLNHFLNLAYARLNADSLALPDSITFNEITEHDWEAGGGVAWRLPRRKGVVGLEYHRSQRHHQQTQGGDGPKAVGWDVRGGLEYRLNPVVTGRIGHLYRWEDRDDFTRRNEYLGHTATLGLSVSPTGSTWTFDSGYALNLLQADFGDPGKPRGSQQQLAAQIRWVF